MFSFELLLLIQAGKILSDLGDPLGGGRAYTDDGERPGRNLGPAGVAHDVVRELLARNDLFKFEPIYILRKVCVNVK